MITASVNIKALETLGYAEHICNYVVILDSWFYGKISEVGISSNLGLILEHITILNEVRILSINLKWLKSKFLVTFKSVRMGNNS